MINILTGKIDCGKTTKVLEIYSGINAGDGFVTKKIYKDNINIGQRIIRLSNTESEIFSLKTNYITDIWNEKCRYLDYSFSEDGIRFAQALADDILAKEIKPIYIDEIGPLEIYNESGLYNIFINLLEINSDMFVSVRDSCLSQLINKFGLKGYKIIAL